MPLTLAWRSLTSLTVEAECLRPDRLASLSTFEIARLPARVGNASVELGELFRVEGDAADGTLLLEGDLRPLRRAGMGMESGSMTFRGDAGDHLGAGMKGGRIDVFGAVGDWAGAEMRGGRLQVRGDAGNSLGAAYPGSRIGMREGVILVGGGVGEDVGLAMRRGLIAVAGETGQWTGRGMVAGSIFVFGAAGRRPGAGMKRGTLALFGQLDPLEPGLLPTFVPAGRFRPPFLTVYLRQLSEWGFPVPETAFSGPLERYNGDLTSGGRGEILVHV